MTFAIGAPAVPQSGRYFRWVGHVFDVYGDRIGVRFLDGAEEWFSDWELRGQ